MCDLTNDVVALLKSLHFVERKIPKHEYLFREGAATKELFVIEEGIIQLSKITPDGKELCLKLCQSDEMIGELSIFSEHAIHMYHAKAMTDVSVLVITKETIEQALSHHPPLSVAFMKWMSEHYRKTETKFRDLLLNGKKGALYSTLIRLTNSYGENLDNGILINVQLTNQQLANFCGTARESVNRMLSVLKKNQIISYHQGKLLVHRLDFLKSEINCDECPVEYCRI
ncbi:Crp/Fnr family transcriptional regulator [Bacillus kexueae]|uniref:Crp/Fnr family transcriptional regulator n=1 Tax=Aeribacillus kexueae TaxID=2078952 RepID=UPI001FAE81EA